MSNVTIDASILAQLIQTLSNTATILSGAITPSEEPKKKRGRPAKAKVQPSKQPTKALDILLPKETEIITIEEESVLEIENEPEQPIRMPNKNSHIFATKKITNSGSAAAQVREDVTKKRGNLKFVDIQNVADRIPSSKYPEPSERRNPAQLMTFRCTKCQNNFQDYPGNVPQAFFKVMGGSGQESQESCAVIHCPKCSNK